MFELHLDSSEDGRKAGTKSHPIFYLADPIKAKRVVLKHASIPMSFRQVFQSCPMYIQWQSFTDEFVAGEKLILIPPNHYSNAQMAALFQAELRTIITDHLLSFMTTVNVNALADGSVNFVYTVLPGTGNFEFVFSSANSPNCRRFAKQTNMTYFESEDYWYFQMPINVTLSTTFNWPAWKFGLPNYIFLRSSLCSGSSWGNNFRGRKEQSENNNILAKVPLRPFLYPANTLYYYENQDVRLDNMFTLNGSEIDKLDMYFTFPGGEEVDFVGYNFSLTLAFA